MLTCGVIGLWVGMLEQEALNINMPVNNKVLATALLCSGKQRCEVASNRLTTKETKKERTKEKIKYGNGIFPKKLQEQLVVSQSVLLLEKLLLEIAASAFIGCPGAVLSFYRYP